MSAIYFCPECGSPAIDRSMLAGSTATCRGCKWSGSSDDLASMPTEGEVGDGAALITRMVGDLRILMMKDVGVTLTRFLSQWGFITGEDKEIMAKQLGRYIAASARAIILACMEERNKMEVERGRSS